MKSFRSNPRFRAAMEIARRRGYQVFTSPTLPGFVIVGQGAPPAAPRLFLGEACDFLEKAERHAAKLARRRVRERTRRRAKSRRRAAA